MVQDRLLSYAISMRRHERDGDRLDALKRVLIAHPVDFEVIEQHFPEFLPPNWREQRAIAKATKEDGSLDLDAINDADLSWSVPDPHEDDEISRWINERERGRATAADLDDGWR